MTLRAVGFGELGIVPFFCTPIASKWPKLRSRVFLSVKKNVWAVY